MCDPVVRSQPRRLRALSCTRISHHQETHSGHSMGQITPSERAVADGARRRSLLHLVAFDELPRGLCNRQTDLTIRWSRCRPGPNPDARRPRPARGSLPKSAHPAGTNPEGVTAAFGTVSVCATSPETGSAESASVLSVCRTTSSPVRRWPAATPDWPRARRVALEEGAGRLVDTATRRGRRHFPIRRRSPPLVAR